MFGPFPHQNGTALTAALNDFRERLSGCYEAELMYRNPVGRQKQDRTKLMVAAASQFFLGAGQNAGSPPPI